MNGFELARWLPNYEALQCQIYVQGHNTWETARPNYIKKEINSINYCRRHKGKEGRTHKCIKA